ncbi:hypothetical protein ACNQFZ_14900 [Schinkia sp. CFF1]
MIQCPVCEREIKDHEYVILDSFTGLTHFACYNYYNDQPIEEIENIGTYATMKETYDFLNDEFPVD